MKNRKQIFFSRKRDRRELTRIVKSGMKRGLSLGEQLILHHNGAKQDHKIQFYDQDMDNFINNLVTVVVTFRYIYTGVPSITLVKIFNKISKKNYVYSRLPGGFFEQKEDVRKFIKNVYNVTGVI